MKYIDAEKLIAEIERQKKELFEIGGDAFENKWACGSLDSIKAFVISRQHERPEENKLPSKRTRVSYAICNLQSFKPLRENIVLDDYVYDEGKCYRENLLNYIHTIPENRLTEIRSYLKEMGWWPYDDDSDWEEQEQPEVDLEKEMNKLISLEYENQANDDEWEMCIARHFYELGLNARKEE